MVSPIPMSKVKFMQRRQPKSGVGSPRGSVGEHSRRLINATEASLRSNAAQADAAADMAVKSI